MNDEGPRLTAGPFHRTERASGSRSPATHQASDATSSGMPGPNVVDTAPFWM